MDIVYSLLKNLPLPRSFKNLLLYPPGHFYSPLPSLREVARDEEKIFVTPPPDWLPGIDLNSKEQLALFHELKKFYPSLPFKEHHKDDMRYYYENPTFSYADAIILHCMVRHLQPKRIIEVGSGYSSCVILDTNELFFDNTIDCTFIEPYPAKLNSLLKKQDKGKVRIIERRLQDFEKPLELESGDMLFIDSTHVAKIHSDVNHLFFNLLPALQAGVYIHMHDIMYPFEYPKEWIYEGRAWNEAYMLRAFLQYNSDFKIMFFTTYLEQFYEELFRNEMPLCLKNRGGSIWLRKQ